MSDTTVEVHAQIFVRDGALPSDPFIASGGEASVRVGRWLAGAVLFFDDVKHARAWGEKFLEHVGALEAKSAQTQSAA